MKTTTYATISRWLITLGTIATLSLSVGVSTAHADVYVNGRYIPKATLKVLEARFGTHIPQGRYWYDKRTGKWGVGDRPPYQAKVAKPAAKPQYRYTEDSMNDAYSYLEGQPRYQYDPYKRNR